MCDLDCRAELALTCSKQMHSSVTPRHAALIHPTIPSSPFNTTSPPSPSLSLLIVNANTDTAAVQLTATRPHRAAFHLISISISTVVVMVVSAV